MSTLPQIVVGAVIIDDGLILAARRTRPAALAGKWEFPGGKVETGEDLREALVREIREELGATIEVRDEVLSSESPWTISEKYTLRLFLATLVGDRPEPGSDHDALQWVAPEKLERVDWLESDRVALRAVQSCF